MYDTKYISKIFDVIIYAVFVTLVDWMGCRRIFEEGHLLKGFAVRYPVVFCVLVALILFGLLALSQAAVPTAPVGDVGALSPEQVRQPTEFERALSSVRNVETLYLIAALTLAAGLLTWLGWWRQAGFNRPSRWGSLVLLWFPLLVVAMTLSGGARISGPFLLVTTVFIVLLTTLGQELIFRGVMWRALAPTGLLKAMIVTSLLSGALTLARTTASGPWPEAIYLTLTASCGGFTYAALRWRTASIWPPTLINFLLVLAIDLATVRSTIYPYLLLASTLGFVVYGLFLIRNRRVRADGALTAREYDQSGRDN